jgi:arabinofuranan 3-O-arabinosyltransferase
LRSRRHSVIPLGLAALGFAMALLQRPGLASSDTKIDLHLDPVRFLGDVGRLWTPTGSLGHVQGGQYGGYLWPMGPFFAALRELGLSPWLVQRLWLGLLLALATWGTVRLLDALLSRERGVAHLVAGLVVLASPYVVVFANRTSETLLGYAALPWMLLVVQRGVRRPRELAWPAAFGLLLMSTGPGVNAATTAWILLGPALLLVYEPLWGGVAWRAARRFGLWAAAAGLLASIWWLGPVVGHALYGVDFLAFTEQPGSIWGSTSLSESLRVMGYWISYLGVGYGDTLRPYFSDSPAMLFDLPVVLAGLLVPALSVAGLVWTRRWLYGPFFALLLLVGLVSMAAGFPEGTPLRKALYFVYNRVDALQFLRTTYKAAPLVALAVACLAGAAAAELGRRLRGRTLAAAGAAALGALLLVLSAWPLVTGQLLDRQVMWKRIPAAWTKTGHDLDRGLPRNSRAAVLPGQPFAFYRWGGTVDPVLPSLTDRPVAVRSTPPYDDLHAVDLLWTVDGLVQQQRLLPGQLPPLLRLLGVRSVVVGSDDRTGRSGAMPPADAARELAGQPGFRRPAAAYGRASGFSSPAADLERSLSLPEVRRYDMPAARGLVRVDPAGPGMLVDGSADALAGLAAFGQLPERAPIAYAGDRTPDELRRFAAAGAELVISDSNRRRVFVSSRTRQTVGATLGARDPVSQDAALLDPFPLAGTSGQTVAELTGARAIEAPFSPGFAQFPEHRPYAAFDGSPRSYWQADPTLEDGRHWVQLELARPRRVPYVDVLPHVDPRAIVTEVKVGGQRFPVHRGWNRLRLGHSESTLRFEITKKRSPLKATDSAGGFDEIRVPGVKVRERLRPPELLTGALAGRGLSHSGLTYLYERTSGDNPFRRGPFPPPVAVQAQRNRAEAEARLVAAAGDAESGLARIVDLPARRTLQADAWASVSPTANDDALDRLAGSAGAARFSSSGRQQGLARYRASAAFDGDPASAWVGALVPSHPAWIAWSTNGVRTLRRLTLSPPPLAARTPARVRLRWDGGRTPALAVGPGGAIRLSRPARGRRFRLDVLATRAATSRGARASNAVAIGELHGPGLPRARHAGGGPLRGRCGQLVATISGQRLPLRLTDSVASLEGGRPLRAQGCGPAITLRAGRHELRAPAGIVRPELLRLRSPAPEPLARAANGGRVLSSGHQGRGSYDDVRVRLPRPAWLVLGESYNSGWRAYCDGRSLGGPRVIDGFANGWGAPAGCHSVHFAFAPQSAVNWAYWIGALACLALAALLVLRARRLRRAAADIAEPLPFGAFGDADRPDAWPLGKAALAGLAAGALFGFVLALRAGVVVAPAVALLLWRGAGARLLLLAAGGLLTIVVPLVYLVFLPRDRGGYNTDYAVDVLGAHWVTAAALVLLGLALWRMLSRATAPSGARAAEPAAAGEARSRA